jgi:hypothetical protein
VDPGGATVAIWPQIEAAALKGQRAKDIDRRLIPEFAMGGLVPYRGGMQTLIKVRPGERIDDAGLMKSWTVPGIDRGYDNVITVATPGSAVRTKQQQSIPGFSGGSNAPSLSSKQQRGDIVFNVADEGLAALMETIFGALRSNEGEKIVIRTARKARMNKEL